MRITARVLYHRFRLCKHEIKSFVARRVRSQDKNTSGNDEEQIRNRSARETRTSTMNEFYAPDALGERERWPTDTSPQFLELSNVHHGISIPHEMHSSTFYFSSPGSMLCDLPYPPKSTPTPSISLFRLRPMPDVTLPKYEW